MKNIFLVAFLVVFGGASVQAQNAAKAKEILSKASSKYKSYKAVKADFKYILEIQAEKFKEEQKGTLYLKKQKFRLEMADQTVICDSKTLWTYMKDVNEVQINNYSPQTMDINPAEIFTMYEKGYLYAYMGEETINKKTVHVVELTPTDKKQSFFKVKLFIDKVTNSIAQSKVFEKNGNIYTFEILNFTPNPPAEDNLFTFDTTKMPKQNVVDLRKKK
ncbi:MAG: outer membrane lipoprotein carrier protein LolA [Sphingobacteriales bacterium]|nr:MAG: outer membrane lipoprotein carrier protein LolA [Sphingobacteriales bacterium]